MSVDDDNSVGQRLKNEKERLMSLINEVEADDVPYTSSHAAVDLDNEVISSGPVPSRARCMKRRSIWGDQVLETAPDENNNPINVFDSLQDPVLEQLTTDLTSHIVRQQAEIDLLKARLGDAEGQLKTSSSWRNTTTSYFNLLLNELGNGRTNRNVLNQLCVCLADHIGAPRISVGDFAGHSEPEARVNAQAASDPVDQLPMKNIFIIASGTTEENLYHTFELFVRKGESNASAASCRRRHMSTSAGRSVGGESGDAGRLTRKSFYLLCFALDLFSTRVSMAKVESMFDRCVLNGGKSSGRFASRLDYQGFCNAITHLCMLHHGEVANQVAALGCDEGPFVYCSRHPSKLGDYVQRMWAAAASFAKNEDKFDVVTGLFEPLSEPKVFAVLMMYQDMLLKEFKVRANYLVANAQSTKGREDFAGDRFGKVSPPKRNHDVSKMHVECGFEKLCVDARIVPKMVQKFATVRRISQFARLFPKESSASYFFACFSCLLAHITENNKDCSESAALSVQSNVEGYTAVMMQVVSMVESATFGERNDASFQA